MLKLLNCIFVFLGINSVNLENFNDINLLFNDYEDVNREKDKKNEGKICYRIFISIVLLIKPIYFLYEIIQDGTHIFYATLFFLINIFVSYIVLLAYFRSNYFEKILFDYYSIKKKHNIFENILDDRLIPILIITISLLTVFVGILSNMFIYRLNDGNGTNYYNTTDIYNFDDANLGVTLAINAIVGLSDIYGYVLILSNSFIFFLVFMKHLMDLKGQVDKLVKKYSWSKDTQHTEVSTMCYEIMWLRNELENSIDKLEPLFVSNTLLGSIALGFIIEYGEMTVFQIISLIYWFISQVTYLVIIYYINDYKGELMKVIKKPKFVIHYIRRKFNKTKFDEVISNINIGRQRKFIDKEFPTSSKKTINLDDVKIDMPQNLIYDEKTDDINIILGNINSETKDNDDINVIMNNVSDDREMVDVDLDEEEITMKEYVVKNSSSIDWIILNTILNENWGCFEFFGFEFSGPGNLKSTIGVTAALILVTQWFLSLNII